MELMAMIGALRQRVPLRPLRWVPVMKGMKLIEEYVDAGESGAGFTVRGYILPARMPLLPTGA